MKSLLLILCMLLVAACSGNHCISVEGEYSGVQGTVEYCYSPKQTTENNAVTFNSDAGQAYLITNDELSEAVKLLEQAHAKNVTPSSMPNNTAHKSVVEKFRSALKRR